MRFCGEAAPGVESFPGFFPLPWAGVSLAVLEVHVGTSLVFSVEGQQAVLPAWYTSHSQNEPYVTWMLNKNAGPFQVRRWRGPSWEVTMEGMLVVPIMGGRSWCQPWGSGHSAHGGRMPVMGGSSWCPPCDVHDGMKLMVPVQGRCPQWVSAHEWGNLMVASRGKCPG